MTMVCRGGWPGAAPGLAALLVAGCGHTSAPGPGQQAQRNAGGGIEIEIDASLKESGTLGAWSLYGIALAGSSKSTGHIGDFTGELAARTLLASAWKEPRGGEAARRPDTYLDVLIAVADAGFMAEYVVSYLAHPGWVISADDLGKMRLTAFKQWVPTHLGGLHRAQTRVRVRSASATPLPVPGAGLAALGAHGGDHAPCQSLEPAVARAATAWDAEAAQLAQVPLSVTSFEELLPSLERAARDPRTRQAGVVLASPAVANTFFMAGFCAVERNAFPEAERHLRRAVALAPASTNVRAELVQTLIVQKRLDDADAELDEALRYPASPCSSGVLWRKRGYILFDRGKLLESYQAYARSLEYDSESAIARREMKLIVSELHRTGGYDEKALNVYTPPPSSNKMTVKVCP